MLISRYWTNIHQSPAISVAIQFYWPVNWKSLRGQVIAWQGIKSKLNSKLQPGDIGRDLSQDCIGSAKFQTEGGGSNLRGCQLQYHIFLQWYLYFSRLQYLRHISVEWGQVHNLGRFLWEWAAQRKWNSSGKIRSQKFGKFKFCQNSGNNLCRKPN